MDRLSAIITVLLSLVAPLAWANTPTTLLELNPVKIYIDKTDRIHVSFQKECGASFAGFVLRSHGENELLIGAMSHRPAKRCLELTAMEELVIPHLKGSRFSNISSLNPSVEPQVLKISPVQNFNQVDDEGTYRFEASFTSQCGNLVGLHLYPGAEGLELGIVEGRPGKFENCNRSTKLASFQALDFGRANLKVNPKFREEDEPPLPFTLRRAQTRLFSVGSSHKLYFFRRCNEAPVGLVRQTSKDGTEISVLLAYYAATKCPEKSADRLWTPWPEAILDKNPREFSGAKTRESLVIKRPISYNFSENSLSIGTYSSCQKDLGIVSRTTKNGYAVGILQLQTSQPCNSSMKELNLSFDWNFAYGVKRDIKPLQLVGS